MKTILRLLVAGIVFVTPSAAIAVEEGLRSNCYIASVPHRAECLLAPGGRVTFA